CRLRAPDDAADSRSTSLRGRLAAATAQPQSTGFAKLLVSAKSHAKIAVDLMAISTEHSTRIKFWGVRGSIPVPGNSTVRYGGNTSCVEVRADGEIIVLDAGTGIRPLGLA